MLLADNTYEINRPLQTFLSNLRGVRRVHSVVYNGYERKRGKSGTESLRRLTSSAEKEEHIQSYNSSGVEV